jgi:mannose-6-phosphate isomerase-like protein (cupin superfamily)
MTKQPILMKRDQWAKKPDQWHGRFEGYNLGGANVTVLFFSSDELGDGPPLHFHPYDEIFIIQEGTALFTVDGQMIEAKAGRLSLPQQRRITSVENTGPGRLATTDIHCNERFISTNV